MNTSLKKITITAAMSAACLALAECSTQQCGEGELLQYGGHYYELILDSEATTGERQGRKRHNALIEKEQDIF